MDVQDYQWIIKNCSFVIENRRIIPVAKQKKNDTIARKILKRNNFLRPSREEFFRISNRLSPQIKRMEQERKSIANAFCAMTPDDVSCLSNEKKVEYLDALIPEDISERALASVINDNKENLRACLFNLTLPKKFWQEEKIKMQKFALRIEQIPEIKPLMKNWKTVGIEARKGLLRAARDVFCECYKIDPIEIGFMSGREMRSRLFRDGKNKDAPIPSAIAQDNRIVFNTDRLKNCGNYTTLALEYHEMLHIAQVETDYSRYPTVDKMFEEKFNLLSADYEELYFLNPREVHAYGLDREFHNCLLDRLSVPEISNQYSAADQKLVDVAEQRSRALYAWQQIRQR